MQQLATDEHAAKRVCKEGQAGETKKKQKQRNKKTSASSTWHSVQNIKLHGSSRERCSGLPILESLGYLGAESIRMRAHTYAVQRNHLRKVKKKKNNQKISATTTTTKTSSVQRALLFQEVAEGC